MMRYAGMLVILATAGGCGGDSTDPLPSDDLTTASLALSATAESNGSLVLMNATLTTEGGQAVTLEGGDQLLLSSPDGEVLFVPSSDSGHVAELATASTTISLVFAREGERLVSTYDLPSPFVLVAPPAPATLAAPLTFTWDIGVGTYETAIDVSSECFNPIHRGLTMDTGAYTLQPADVGLYPSAITSCDVRVTVTRAAMTGTIAQGFAAPGPQRAVQTRQIRFHAAIQ